MKDPPAIVDPRWPGGDFLRRPCFGATPRRAGRVDQPWAFIFVNLATFSLGVVSGPHAYLLSILKMPGRIFTAGADRHSDTRRRLRH